MAYRRKHGPQRSLTFIEDTRSSSAALTADEVSSLPSPHLAAHAIRASAAHRDSSSLSSAYEDPSVPHADDAGGPISAAAAAAAHRKHLLRSVTYATPQDAVTYEYTSMKSLNEAKYGFWEGLARKAKSILEDDNASQEFEDKGRSRLQMFNASAGGQFNQPDYYEKEENSPVKKGSELASSLQHIGGTIKNAFEEGLIIVENKTADIIQETKKLQIRRKTGNFSARNEPAEHSASNYLYQNLNDHETQLKASRNVANAMAAKAKLLLRELKTVKADLAFAKERCAQLEEENKLLRESCDKGVSIEDDDLIRLQLETLLEEKGRLAHENSIYARENRFLREIVEYHQLTMQDVVYVNEGIEEVQEVCPIQLPPHLSHSSPGRLSPIVSRAGSPNKSNHTSPRSLNVEDPPEIFLTAASSSPSSPAETQPETRDGTPPPSPKYEGLRRQRSLTPS